MENSDNFYTNPFKDLEIFLVFKEAYDPLSQGERLGLIARWKEKFGSEEPPESEEEFSPLFWLRKNPIFWKKGGQFWWWAAHALMADEGFRIMDDGRVIIDLPEAESLFSS